MTSITTLKRMAARTRAAARRAHKSNLAAAKHLGDDAELCEMADGDFNDLMKVAEYIEQGKLGLARRKLVHMDTAARDDCPEEVYNWLFQ